jgi:serine/threonine protein kinase
VQRLINELKSVREFLEACHDFIKAHRSLYYDGKILHRDISQNNIIVTDAEGEGDPRGMLIGVDFAKKSDSGPCGARHRTGTMEFMAIEVLENRAHAYRYDLELFSYLFLWFVIRYSQETVKNLPNSKQVSALVCRKLRRHSGQKRASHGQKAVQRYSRRVSSKV